MHKSARKVGLRSDFYLGKFAGSIGFHLFNGSNSISRLSLLLLCPTSFAPRYVADGLDF